MKGSPFIGPIEEESKVCTNSNSTRELQTALIPQGDENVKVALKFYFCTNQPASSLKLFWLLCFVRDLILYSTLVLMINPNELKFLKTRK